MQVYVFVLSNQALLSPLTVIPEIIFPNDGFTGYVVNVTDAVSFECIATGIPPPTVQWFRGGMLLTPEGESGSGQNMVSSGEQNSRLMLGEPSQMMIPTPAGNIYQVERTLTFDTNGNDTYTYTCMASNVNAVQPIATHNFTLFVQGRSQDMK